MTEKTSTQFKSLNLAVMALLVALCASWGLQQVTIKVAIQGISPVLQAGIRSLGAAVLVGVWMGIRRVPLWEKDGTLWWGIAAGLLFAGEFLLLYWGLEYTHASRSAVLMYVSPFVVALEAYLFIPGEKIRLIQVGGLCCAFAGIVAAFSESFRLLTVRMLVGDSMVLAAGVFWGATTVLIKASPLVRISPGKTLLYQLVVSAVVLPIGSVAMGEPGVTRMTWVIAGCIAYQAFWVASITYLAWFWLIQHYPPSRLASFTFLTPLFGVLGGGLLLNEPMTPLLLLALVLVGSGIYLVNRPAAGS
ncbi:Permease of the drug/metabolite transporter (DMT) superfamily [Olavius algarvensis associated proteobacterium Delta 3]|nr:Permease of the drug/metabolite transporter (DMT) superfamily [Olavius algarvensis associated proteobacterium Delta 3]